MPDGLSVSAGMLGLRKGRGAISNSAVRFESTAREAFDDGWGTLADPADLPPLPTTLLKERAKSALTFNESPDIGFDRSLNPYRGCTHGCHYCFARRYQTQFELGPGGLVHVDAATPRQVWNAGDEELVILAVGGAGGYVERDGHMVDPADVERRKAFAAGDVYEHPLGRTVTETDNIWMTLLTQNTAPIHFDSHYAAQTEFGRRLVDSTFTLALVTGQSVTDVSQNVMANLGWDEVRGLRDRGWEIGAHTCSHPHLTRCDEAALGRERRLQAAEQGVEGAGQLRELVAAARGPVWEPAAAPDLVGPRGRSARRLASRFARRAADALDREDIDRHSRPNPRRLREGRHTAGRGAP